MDFLNEDEGEQWEKEEAGAQGTHLQLPAASMESLLRSTSSCLDWFFNFACVVCVCGCVCVCVSVD